MTNEKLAYKDLSRLLLLGCSQRKRPDEGLLPAIDRYDGPAFRVLRRFLNQDLIPSVDVKILSAEYGLIPTSYLLPYYDRRITKEQSKRLRCRVITELETVFSSKSYTNLLICLGRDYLEAIYDYESIIPAGLAVHQNLFRQRSFLLHYSRRRNTC